MLDIVHLGLSVTWKLFGSPGKWYEFDLDCILVKEDKLFKFTENLDILG